MWCWEWFCTKQNLDAVVQRGKNYCLEKCPWIYKGDEISYTNGTFRYVENLSIVTGGKAEHVGPDARRCVNVVLEDLRSVLLIDFFSELRISLRMRMGRKFWMFENQREYMHN